MIGPPCCVHVDRRRVNTQAALVSFTLLAWLPISAVVPSEESATQRPKLPLLLAPTPVSFAPCWAHTKPARVNAQAAPAPLLSLAPPIRAVVPSDDRTTLVPKAPWPL